MSTGSSGWGLLLSKFVSAEQKRGLESGSDCSIIFASPSSDPLGDASIKRYLSLKNANRQAGKVAEWSNAPDSKSGVQLCCTVGSNPTLSARIFQEPREVERLAGFLFCGWPNDYRMLWGSDSGAEVRYLFVLHAVPAINVPGRAAGWFAAGQDGTNLCPVQIAQMGYRVEFRLCHSRAHVRASL